MRRWRRRPTSSGQCFAVATRGLPENPQWHYEIKFDGFRVLGLKSGGKPHLLSRNGKDFSRRFPSIVSALANPPDETVVDCEIVAFDE
jgi:bifunctional non-homologous end joining protein LigD